MSVVAFALEGRQEHVVHDAIHFPAGVVTPEHGGQILVYGRWVCAVAVSRDLYLLMSPRLSSSLSSTLVDQLTGFLVAHDCESIRVFLRFPSAWSTSTSTSQIVEYWLDTFLTDCERQLFLLRLDEGQPTFTLSFVAIVESATFAWESLARMDEALIDGHPLLLPGFRRRTERFAHWWEQKFKKALYRVQRFTPEIVNTEIVVRCDRAFISFVETAFKDYELSISTLLRRM